MTAPAEPIEGDDANRTVPNDGAAATSSSNVNSVIELENLSMSFRRNLVLRDLALKIPRGQTLCVIGESGCGKTVLLKLMIGLMRPSKGIVRFGGRDLAQMREAELNRVRLRFGFLFQMAALSTA